MRQVVFLVFVVFGASCSRGTLDAKFVGTFQLSMRDGRALPAPLPQTYLDKTCKNEMLSATLVITTSSRWSESYRARRVCGPEGVTGNESIEREDRGLVKYESADRSMIVLTSKELDGEGAKQFAVVRGDELHMTFRTSNPVSEMSFVYRRLRE